MRIEQLRKEKGLSQEELSNIIGIKQKTLSNYENNDTSNKLNNFIKLANYFNVSLT